MNFTKILQCIGIQLIRENGLNFVFQAQRVVSKYISAKLKKKLFNNTSTNPAPNTGVEFVLVIVTKLNDVWLAYLLTYVKA